MDCCRQPSIPHRANPRIQGHDEELGPQVPCRWEEGHHHRGGEFALQLLLPSLSQGFFLISLFFSICLSSFLPLSLFFLTANFVFLHYIVLFYFCGLLPCIFSQISNLYAEGVRKLRSDNSWKDAKPAFTCDLWHSRCMKEYFTMTAHWIEIREDNLGSKWVLRNRVLGAFPVQEVSIDHQGEY